MPDIHPALSKLIAEAEARVASAPGRETARLIRNRADELDLTHTKAFNGHRRTLAAMRRDGVTGFDIRIAIDRLNHLANVAMAPTLVGAE